jgi:hypothetical protein
MLLAFLQAYWWAPMVSLGALLVQCTLPRPEVTLMLLVLTALAWGIPLAYLWGQTRTGLVACDYLPGPFDTLTPDTMPAPPPTPEPHFTHRPQMSGMSAPRNSYRSRGSGAYRRAVTQTRGSCAMPLPGLHQSFHGLHSQTQRSTSSWCPSWGYDRTNQYDAIVPSHDATIYRSHLSLLQYFIDLVVNISKQKRRDAYKIDDMVRQMDGILPSRQY